MPTPHTRIQLERFLATVHQRRTMAPVLRYARDRSKPKFVGILDSTILCGDAIIARDLIQTCIRSNPCGMFGCPECGCRLKRREKREALKAIIAKADGIPQEHEISWVTVDGPLVALDLPEDEVRKVLKPVPQED
jgi:hypothetical protein